MNRPRRRGKSAPALALLALLAVTAVVLLAAPAERAEAQAVHIPDPALRARLNYQLGKPPTEPITRAEMRTLATSGDRRLALSRPPADRNNPALAIRDLTGLEHLTGIWALFLEYHEISDLTPLAGLTSLATLSLNYNRISDLSPLARLTNLQTLDVHYNLVSDLPPLAGLTSLTSLGLNSNRISNLGPLAGLTSLTNLSITRNRISDLGPLAGLTSLTNLFLGTNRVSDLTPLRGLTSLYHLHIYNNEVRDLGPLTGLSGLYRLSAGSNRIGDLSPLVASSAWGSGDIIDLRDNPGLGDDDDADVATLRARGVTVYANSPLGLNRTVRGVSVSCGVERLRVAWEPLTDYDPPGYTVQWKSGTQLFSSRATPPRHEIVLGAGTTSYTIPDLTPGIEYTVRVRSYGKSGDPSGVDYCAPLSVRQLEEARARALAPVLAGMGRTIAADVVDMVEERFDSRRGGARVALGGLALTSGPRAASGGPAPGAAPPAGAAGHDRYSAAPARGAERMDVMDAGGEGFGEVSAADLLFRSSFDLPLSGQDAPGAADDTGWRLWGRGTAGGFEGKPKPGFSMEGEVSGGYVGLDWRPYQDVLLGMAIGRTSGEIDYEADAAASTDGTVDLEVTSFLPWAYWQPRPGVGVWGLLGAGRGDAELKDELGETETDVKMRMAASGLRREVATWRGIDLAVKADTFWTEMETVAARRLPETRGVAKRLRLRVEGRTEWEVSAVSQVASALDVGGRWDGGDAETGLGAEVGGSVAYAHTGLGLAVDARGRYLLAHRESALEEWGGSLTAKLDPGQAGVGPSVKLTPGWGVEGSRIAQIWDSPEALRPNRSADGTSGLSPDRLALDAGYGLAYRGKGLLTPYTGLSMARPSVRGYKVGTRLEVGERLGLGVEGRRSVWAAGSARNEVTFHVRMRW